MAAQAKKVLFDNQALIDTANGEAVATDMRDCQFVGFIKTTNQHADTTVAGKIEHSPNGTNWFTLVEFDSLAAAGTNLKNITAHVLPWVRGVATLNGTTKQSAVEMLLYYSTFPS